MENLFARVLRKCVGKTVQEMGTVSEDGLCVGVRVTFTDGYVVQFVYDVDDADLCVQEVEGE